MQEADSDTTHPPLRVAAAGDVHCREDAGEKVRQAMSALRGAADLLLLCGDLTTHGRPEQGKVLAEACAELDMPILAVLGNHDWHCNQADELIEALEQGGIRVLERDHTVCRVAGIEVGVVGVKGFVGGFAGSHLPDFGEPLLRQVYRETTAEVEALERGLRQVSLCPIRIVMLHYAPVEATIVGEEPGIWSFLGTDRLAPPINEFEPDLVLHGHAHAGTFRGAIGQVPVYNVSVPVLGRDFWIFELEARDAARSAIR